MSKLRFKVVEEAFDRKAVKVDIPEKRPHHTLESPEHVLLLHE